MKVHVYEPGNPAAVTHPDTDGVARLRELVIIEAGETVYQVGGTTVVDPPKKPAAVLPFIAAMAGFDTGAGHWVPAAESGRSAPQLIAAAHPG